MTQTVGREIASEGHRLPTDWSQSDWQKVRRVVQSLRFRIFRATQQQDWRKVRGLTRLLLKSYSNLLVSIRRVTQVNRGKHTPGVDGEVVDTPEKRGKLAKELRVYQPWKALPARRVYIPKAKGKVRPLGIFTLRDRVLQAVVKNALEPRFEATFEAHSYGFRPGRGCQDAIEVTHNALSESAAGGHQYILDADIKGAFDHISHEFVLHRLGNLPGRELVKQWLKAGYVEWGKLHQSIEGSAQGAVISPLLATVALDGLGCLLGKGYRIAQYADDLVVMAKNQEAIEQTVPKIEAWLRERGLELNWEKTRIVHRAEGFNFLGFHIKLYGKKLLIKPQKEKIHGRLRGIKAWLDQHKTVTMEAVIRHLKPILHGWALYYRHVIAQKTFEYVDHRVWWMLWKWAKRRHPNKGSRWVATQYFHNNRAFAQIRDRQGRPTRIYLEKMSTTPILRHVKVKGRASPDDPSLIPYWEQRRIKMGRSRLPTQGKLYRVAERQDWRCLGCGNALFNGELVELHHMVPIKLGGTDDEENLLWLHETCHRQRHSQQRAALGHVA